MRGLLWNLSGNIIQKNMTTANRSWKSMAFSNRIFLKNKEDNNMNYAMKKEYLQQHFLKELSKFEKYLVEDIIK